MVFQTSMRSPDMPRTMRFLVSNGTIGTRNLRDRLGRLSGARHSDQNANPLAKRDKFRQGSDLHFLHHPVAMGLDRAFGRAQRVGDLLVGLAANDMFEDFPLARRQCRDMSANDVQLALQATRRFMMRYSPLNGVKKVVRRYGLGQKILRARLDGPHRGRNIGITGEKHDRQRRAELAQATLELRTAQSRYPHVEQNAAQCAFTR